MKKQTVLIWLMLIGCQLVSRAQTYFPVPPIPDNKEFSRHISSTVYLLSRPETAGQVRILVYGQSISEQDWWKEVKAFLEKQYAGANLQVTNLAVGGFSTDRLKLIVENDVRTLYPDLILLHDYGNAADYERIIQTIRSNTTAEIALQTDHIGLKQNDEWHEQHSTVTLPALARKYNLGLIDVRAVWKAYLAKHALPASGLLSDNVHLNAHGNYLMAEIVKNYFRNLPPPTENASANRQVLQAGKDFPVNKKTIAVPVRGNRVDLVWDDKTRNTSPVAVQLDGKKPSAYTGSYCYTRPVLAESGTYLGKMGKLLALRLGKPAVEESWILTITAVDTLKMQMQFSLRGSLTGEDGSGNSDSVFTSHSGKIIIEPHQWFRRRSPNDFRQFSWIAPGDRIEWQVKLMGSDTFKPAPSAVVTVVQGVENGNHMLQLTGKDLSGLREIHVYQPPLQE